MSDGTLIGWADATWNPVTGCDVVDEGCKNCYAKVFAERFRGVPGHHFEHGFDVQLRPQMLERPLHWTRPRRIFVNSMSDLFHQDVPDEYRDKVFAVMALCPQHTFQILTKRIELALEYLSKPDERVDAIGEAIYAMTGRLASGDPADDEQVLLDDLPLPNVLIGPTVANQRNLTARGPYIARLHELGWRTMVSYEPALGPIDLDQWLALEWFAGEGREPVIDWLICGAESGSNRRRFEYDWARGALRACRAAGVPFFMKQDSAFRSEVFDTLPDDLKVREFPAVLG